MLIYNFVVYFAPANSKPYIENNLKMKWWINRLNRYIIFIGVALLAIGIVAIIFSLVQLPFIEQESYDVPNVMILIDESFMIPTTGNLHRTCDLESGDLIKIYFSCTSGGNMDVDFYVMDELNYFKWKAGESHIASISLSRTTGYNQDFTVPFNATWYFVWDNSFSSITQKGVTADITKNWNEIAYRDLMVYHTMVSSEYANYVEYLGIALVLAGIAGIAWGYASKEKGLPLDKRKYET